MLSLSKFVSATALSRGVLGMAAAQQIDDVTGQAGSAANGVATEASAADMGAKFDNSAASTALDVDRTQGSVSGQADAANPGATPSQRADADADLNLPERQTNAAAEAEAAADTATGEGRGELRQRTETPDAQLDSNTEVGSSPNATTRNSDSRTNNRAGVQTGSQLQNSTAGMTFRSNADGIVIDNVAENSAAARLGLQQGDEIVRFNGQWVNDTQQLRRMMNNVDSSSPVDISFRRGGRQFGRQIALHQNGQNQSAMRPNYDNFDDKASASATVNSNAGMTGDFQNQPVRQAGFSQPCPARSGYQYGTPAHGSQSHVSYGHSYVGCCDNEWDARRCRKAWRRARRCCR